MTEGKIDWLWPVVDLEEQYQIKVPLKETTDPIADAMAKALAQDEAEKDGRGV